MIILQFILFQVTSRPLSRTSWYTILLKFVDSDCAQKLINLTKVKIYFYRHQCDWINIFPTFTASSTL